MGTLTQDLERVAATVRSVTDHEVEVVDNAVYVNFDFAAAVVLEPELTEHGQMWNIWAGTWDRTHALDSVHEMGAVYERDVPPAVTQFLEREEAKAAELEKMLEGMPEE